MTPQSIVRGWAHDAICASGDHCERGDSDHARRTQAIFARDVVRAWKAGVPLVQLIHDRMCPCLNRDPELAAGHVHLFQKAADELTALLITRGPSQATTPNDGAAA